jgi:hypothetical protein
VTEEEAQLVEIVAAQRVTWGDMKWDPVMRYGRLFTPGTAAGGAENLDPADACENAYRKAANSGLVYAEGWVLRPDRNPMPAGWCLDGETVVDPGFPEPAVAYFGVALDPGYVRRIWQQEHDRAGTNTFRGVFTLLRYPPLDPVADIAGPLGRDIPAWVRAWALAAEQATAVKPPAWIKEELLRFSDAAEVGSVTAGPESIVDEVAPDQRISPASGLHVSRTLRGRDMEQSGERERPELAEQKLAEVHLQWATGLQAHYSFGVLHRLDYNVWDAWLHPTRVQGQTVAEGRPRRLTRNGVSYEMALLALSLAMGDAMPEEFLVVYR